MINDRFSFEAMRASESDKYDAWMKTYQVLRDIAAFSGTSLYSPSDHAAARDAVQAMEYLMEPVTVERIIQQKAEYKPSPTA